MRYKTIMAASACALAAAAGTAIGYGGGGGSYGGGSYGDRNGCDLNQRSGSYGSGSGYGSGGDLNVIGLTSDNRLICFQDDEPGNARDVGRVTGLTTDTKLVGIDYRPATGNDGDRGDLYGLGDQGGVYVINDQNGQATLRSRLNVALSGASFGVDFNPVVDRLRVISDNGQNLRVNVDTGATLVDGTLNYPAPPAAPTPATGVTGAAYTNNDADPNTATTLFDIDSTLDQTSIQSPANSGQLAATGKLGVDTNTTIGSDIYSTIRNGTTVDLRALAALTVGGKSVLYRIDLLQGRASARGSFSKSVTGVAIPLNQL